jgi:predicted permease
MYERFERTAELIKAMPGVRAVSLSQRPLASVGSTADRFVTPNGVTFSARILYIRSNFFDTMGMRLLSGRSISPDDRRETPKVIIINETLARTYLANNNPIGARLGEQEIVGIVSDAKYTSFRQDTPPTIYIPYTQGPVRQMTFEVRSTATDPLSLLPQIREAVRQVDKNLPVTDVRTQTEQIGRTMASERLFAVMSSLFGGLALLLACVGLYGLMSYSVARRTNEIGLRMALGAAQRDVLRSMMRESLMPVFAGVILGVGGALPLTRTIKATLFGLTPYDPATVTIAILVMIAVAAFAGYLPARKASKVDPLIALRYE